MEFNRDLYKRACSKLTAPPDTVKEVIRMTEMQKKPRKWTRRMLVAAAVTALAVLTAMGANAASGGELFARIVSYVEYEQDGEKVGEIVVEIDDSAIGGNATGEYTISIEGEEGKPVLSYTDEDGNKVSKEIDLSQAQRTGDHPLVCMKDEDGKEITVRANAVEYYSEAGRIRLYLDGENGQETWIELTLKADTTKYLTFQELLAGKDAIAGVTDDGQTYTIRAE